MIYSNWFWFWYLVVAPLFVIYLLWLWLGWWLFAGFVALIALSTIYEVLKK